jgi:hypothetical protein
VKARRSDGIIKRPNMKELYQFAFGVEFIDKHRVSGDVRALKECYFKVLV